MPTRATAPKGAPCWIDLGSSDTDRSRSFYGELFGWTSEATGEEFGGYINFAKDGVPVAGCMQKQDEMGPDGWSVYLESGDITKMTELAGAAGGQVAVPPMPVGNLGQMAFVTDVGGAVIGAWQPGEHTGFGVYGEPGTPGWFELHTRDWDGALAFYREVFGEEIEIVSDTPELRYAVFTDGEDQVAGIMDAAGFPEDAPAQWSIYFTTDDADASIVHAVALGASVVHPAEDTPYGRLAALTDPTGAGFKLLQPPSA